MSTSTPHRPGPLPRTLLRYRVIAYALLVLDVIVDGSALFDVATTHASTREDRFETVFGAAFFVLPPGVVAMVVGLWLWFGLVGSAPPRRGLVVTSAAVALPAFTIAVLSLATAWLFGGL